MRSTLKPYLAAVGLATLASLGSRRADACSCPMNVLVSPPPNAGDVPLNAVVIFESPTAPVLFDETHNAEIAVTAEPFTVPRMWLVRPNQPLPAQSTIRVTPPQAPGAPVPRFTTGTTSRDVAPQYTGATSFSAEFFDVSQSTCKSSCWVGDKYQRMRVDYPVPPADSSLLLLEVRRAGDDAGALLGTVALDQAYPGQAWSKRIDRESCTIGAPQFEADEPICARIVAYGVTGLRSDPSPEICTTVAACAPSFDQFCSVLDSCGPSGEPPDTGDGGPNSPDGGSSAPDATDSGAPNQPDATDSGGPREPDATPPVDPPDAPDAGAPPANDASLPPGNQPDSGGSTPPPGNPGGTPDSDGCSIAPGASQHGGAVSTFFALFAASALLRRRDPSCRAKRLRGAK
ncbi:MAG: hypothetical protein ABW133_14220 [Polyangiaceae bacterium]